MKILVCGGAGYIGAHMCKILSENGFKVTVFDNLSTGVQEAIRGGEANLWRPTRQDCNRQLPDSRTI